MVTLKVESYFACGVRSMAVFINNVSLSETLVQKENFLKLAAVLECKSSKEYREMEGLGLERACNGNG